ncbi:MAG: hypothetical protein GEEBNDBF_02645 [bacterium]|nr:hypothetical protein [bacterium]
MRRGSSLWMQRFLGCMSLIGCLFATGIPGHASASIDEQHWYGAYMQGTKIGFAVMGKRATTFAGVPAVESFMDTTLEISLLGAKQQLTIQERDYVDPDTRGFLGAEVFMQTGLPGMDQHTRMRREGNEVVIELLSGEVVTSSERRPWEAGAISAQEAAFQIAEQLDPATGGEFSFLIFSAATQSATQSTMTYSPARMVYHEGVEIQVYEVTSRLPAMGMTSTATETVDGVVLKTTMLSGLFELRLEDETLAQSPTGTPDMLAMSRVETTGERLPRQPVRHLELRPVIDDPVEQLFPETGRQRLQQSLEGPVLVIDMLGVGQGPQVSLTLEERERWTGRSLHVQSDDPRIVELARHITGHLSPDDDAGRAFAITRYVFETLKKEMVPTTPNALQVLEMGKGDCGEHAVLTVALLRAAGLPAKTLYGLVYTPLYGQGFFYHAWNAVLVDDRWLEVDSALGMFPADATHVVVGEADDLATATAIMPLYGRLAFDIQRALGGSFPAEYRLTP